MQSWLGSKKKAACNIDVFNLKVLTSIMESEELRTPETTTYMAFTCHHQNISGHTWKMAEETLFYGI